MFDDNEIPEAARKRSERLWERTDAQAVRDYFREKKFYEWQQAGRPGSGRKRRIVRNAKRRARR